MRTITRKVYTIDEIKDVNSSGYQTALYQMAEFNTNHDWWEYVYDDAKEIGLKITGFDCGLAQSIYLEQLVSAEETADLILKNHGDMFDTYKAAQGYKMGNLSGHEFIIELKNCYLRMLEKEYEYLHSEESCEETARANEYEFYESGELI